SAKPGSELSTLYSAVDGTAWLQVDGSVGSDAASYAVAARFPIPCRGIAVGACRNGLSRFLWPAGGTPYPRLSDFSHSAGHLDCRRSDGRRRSYRSNPNLDVWQPG